MSYHIKIVASNAIYGNSLGSQNFGIRGYIEALIPVGTRPFVYINESLCFPVPQFKILIFCVPFLSDHQILNISNLFY